jgi:hypothetical protein
MPVPCMTLLERELIGRLQLNGQSLTGQDRSLRC